MLRYDTSCGLVEEDEELAPALGPYVGINLQPGSPGSNTSSNHKPPPPPSKWLAHLPLGVRLVLTAALLLVFFTSVSGVPIWNKQIFSGALPGATPFPYALTVTFLQLTGTDVLLMLVVAATGLLHICQSSRHRHRHGHEKTSRRPSWSDPTSSRAHSNHVDTNNNKKNAGSHHVSGHLDELQPQPFYFTHRFYFKLWHTLPIGVLFGFKLGLTNWGLHLAPTVNFHLLIQACSLFFVIVFAFLILRERPTLWALLCAGGATAGAILVSLDFEHDEWGLGDKWWVLGVNFASAIFEGLSIVFLRRARNILAKAFPEERDVLLIIQITFMKLVISALTVLPFALVIEGWWNPLKAPILWAELPDTSWTLVPYIFVGAVITFLFQCDYTTLTFLAGAQDVGVLSHVKIVPQVGLSEAVYQNFDPTWEKLVGLVLVVVSGVCYGVLKWFHLTTHKSHHHRHSKPTALSLDKQQKQPPRRAEDGVEEEACCAAEDAEVEALLPSARRRG